MFSQGKTGKKKFEVNGVSEVICGEGKLGAHGPRVRPSGCILLLSEAVSAKKK